MDLRRADVRLTIEGVQCSGHRQCCDGRGQFNETYGTNESLHYTSTALLSIRQLCSVKETNHMDHQWMNYQKSPSSILQINTKKMEKSYMSMGLIYSHVSPSSSKNSGIPSNLLKSLCQLNFFPVSILSSRIEVIVVCGKMN